MSDPPHRAVTSIAVASLLVGTLACRSVPDSAYDPPEVSLSGLPTTRIVYNPALTNETARVQRDVVPGTTQDSAARSAELERKIHDAKEKLIRSYADRVFSGDSSPGLVTFYYRSENQSGAVLPSISLLSLGTLNLLGFPFVQIVYDVHVSVVIDANDGSKPIRFRAKGRGSAFAAAYWGFGTESTQEMAALRGTRDALANLDAVLAGDEGRMRRHLGR